MSQRKLRVGMVGGGGPANFFGAPHRRGDPDGQLGRADRRRAAEQARRVDRRGPRAVHAPRLSRLGDDDQGRGRPARVRADRLRHDRHAQRRPLRPGRRGGGRGHRRALREAADDHARRGPPAPRHRPVQGTSRSSSPTPTPASRWSCWPASWCTTARSARSARSRRGIPRGGWPPSSRPKTRSRPRGGSIPPRPAARAAAATSAPTPTSSSGSSPGCRPSGCAPGSRRSSPAGRSTTTSPSWPSSITAASPRSPPRRSRSAPRTTTASASSARPERSNGRSPTTPCSSTTPAASRCKLYRQGAEYGYFPASIKPYLRLPSGHPEGFHEALANLHRTLEWTIRGRRGETVPKPFEHPGIADGVAGMAFIEAAVASSKQDGEWVEVPKVG